MRSLPSFMCPAAAAVTKNSRRRPSPAELKLGKTHHAFESFVRFVRLSLSKLPAGGHAQQQLVGQQTASQTGPSRMDESPPCPRDKTDFHVDSFSLLY